MNNAMKPLLRGHLHQAAFFTALGACLMLISKARAPIELGSSLVYSFGLIVTLGMSALYHRPQWSPTMRARMRRLDHASIFLLIIGTFTPICFLGVQGEAGRNLFYLVVASGTAGILQSLFFRVGAKWLSTLFYLGVGWLAFPYFGDLKAALSTADLILILGGGILYSLGGIIYAVGYPSLWPRVFGYHEMFHLLVIVAALLHFLVVNSLIGIHPA